MSSHCDCGKCGKYSHDHKHGHGRDCHSCKPEFRDDGCCCAQVVAAYVQAIGTTAAGLVQAIARNPAIEQAYVTDANLAITNALDASNQYLCKQCKMKLTAPKPFTVQTSP